MRSSTGASRRTSSPASRRTEAALVWSRNASRLTAGSSGTGSSRKRSQSRSPPGVGSSVPGPPPGPPPIGSLPIDRLLEAIHADAAIGVEEPFAGLADRAVLFDRALDGVDDAVLVEAGAGDLGLAGLLVARAA